MSTEMKIEDFCYLNSEGNTTWMRVLNVLKAEKINTVAELISKSQKDLYALPFIGERSMKFIKTNLIALGLELSKKDKNGKELPVQLVTHHSAIVGAILYKYRTDKNVSIEDFVRFHLWNQDISEYKAHENGESEISLTDAIGYFDCMSIPMDIIGMIDSSIRPKGVYTHGDMKEVQEYIETRNDRPKKREEHLMATKEQISACIKSLEYSDYVRIVFEYR